MEVSKVAVTAAPVRFRLIVTGFVSRNRAGAAVAATFNASTQTASGM